MFAGHLGEARQNPRRHRDHHQRARETGNTAQYQPCREVMIRAHRERANGDQGETAANGGARRDGGMHCDEAAGEVAQIVCGGEPTTLNHGHAVVCLHHRKDRREREPPDSHRDGESRQAADRHGEGRLNPG